MKEIKVAAVSDLHGTLDFAVPACDVLVIAGDICPADESHHPVHQRHWLDKKFFPWCNRRLGEGDTKEIVFTPGNHDFVFENAAPVPCPPHVTCLIDAHVEVCGVRIYGTPWSPIFRKWAFLAEDSESGLGQKFESIPPGMDILLSHGPAFGLCDTVLLPAWNADEEQKPLGSHALRTAALLTEPHWLVCGHIHTGSHVPEALGTKTLAVNVSLVDERYNVRYRPFEFTIRKGE